MAGADIGGDTSVEWTIVSDNFRKKDPPTSAQNGNGWKHHGIDETDIGPGHDFDISIKIPRDSDDAKTLADTLTAAAADAQAHIGVPGWRVSFKLPIEEGSSDQIQIRWESSTVVARQGHGNVTAARARFGAVKKGPSKKSRKEARKKTSTKGSKKSSKRSSRKAARKPLR